MFNTTAENPKIPLFLQIVTSVECLVVFSAAAVLFFLPDLGKELWAWSAPPFNSRFIGAIYFAALAPLITFAVTGRWTPGRIVLWMIFAFTTAIMIAMLIHWNNFEWGRPATWAFWFLYLFLPVNSTLFLYLLRNLNLADAQPTPDTWRYVLIASAIMLGLYGVALLLTPEAVTSFWPWPVDAFHGRIYTATFLTPAVGALLIQKKGSPFEYFTLGLTLLILGVASIAGVLITTATVPPAKQVDFGALGTWAYFFMNLVLAILGGGLMMLGRTLVTEVSAAPKGFNRPAHVRPVTPAPATQPVIAKSAGVGETIEIRRPAGKATVTVEAGGKYRLEFSGGKKVALSGQPEYFVGRADPSSNWAPAANLAPLGGEKEGVSRQHARIFLEGIVPYLEDLGSHNGTFVNDQRLQPNKPVMLKNNDRVRFGGMSAVFQVES